MNYDRIREALPVESGNGRRSTIRARSDVVEVVIDCVLRRRQFKEIAQRCCVDLESLTRFRKRFITAEVEKIVLVEANKLDADALNQEVNAAQDKIEGGIEGILKEQKRLYRTLNGMVEDGGDNLMDVLAPMMQLLRDQNKSYENLLKVYSNLRDKTTVVLGLNEHPDVQKLMDVLWVVFQAHPEAFETFRQVVQDRRIPLNVE
ncbi:hypothetical protein [Mameliella alba]|uniref:Uncharacterized protein n=1 Tax=Mameliella alba TaxID=561184 RepID=A0A0B3SBN7_9RHOB|nr:hypothetical protein [Mameliella alba]KHQ54101.1 hypothetical protein OA50_01329 [Mameliella alba]